MKRETLAQLVRRNRIKRKAKPKVGYVKYSKVEPGEDIPELAEIRDDLLKRAQSGEMFTLTPEQRQAIAYRYAEGMARLEGKKFVTGQAIATYLGLHLSTVYQITRRRITGPMAKKLAKGAKRA